MPDEDSRQKLLDAAVAHVAAHGWGDLSLRRLATALGTSHRMLLYHFGSKEGLLSAVVGEVEAQQRAAMAELEPQPGEAPADVGWRFWERLTDPELAPLERLFFEMVGQALQGRPGTEGLLANLVEPWVEPVIDAAERVGLPPEAAAADVASTWPRREACCSTCWRPVIGPASTPPCGASATCCWPTPPRPRPDAGPGAAYAARKRRRRRLLVTTKTLENAMAAPASIGFSSPAAATGRAATL